MKRLHPLAFLFLILSFAIRHSVNAAPSQQLTSPDQVPEGLAKSDWSSIRAAYEAGRHAFMPIEGGWQARNPGQQWTTKFDGRGFIAQPRDGGWQWGLELKSYGYAGQERAIGGAERKPAVKAHGQRLSYDWDAAMQEWWVNDKRGLEHGFTVAQRACRATAPVATAATAGGAPALQFELAVRGTLTPHVTADALGVEFRDATGATVLNYTGLKVWDADGKTLASRFEAAGENRVRLLVDERTARYPITIDPIAQQAYVKSSNNGNETEDHFGSSVAVSGDTVVVGAPYEDSSSTGVNSTPDDLSSNSGAAYVFVRSGTTWTQQAYLKPAAVGTTQAGDGFGGSVAVSGDTVVVGASGEDSSTTGVNSTSNESAFDAGAAYVFVRGGTTWTQQAYLKPAAIGTTQAGDWFGSSVAVSGDSVVVGAMLEDSSTTGVNSTPNESAAWSGAAYTFVRSGTVWSQQAYLKPAAVGTTQAGDFFGKSVGISGDSVLIGAYSEDSSTLGVNGTPNDTGGTNFNSGAAYVFVRSGTVWSQQAYLKPAAVGTTQQADEFGTSVAISGDTVIVGAPLESSDTTGVNSTPNESEIAAGAAYVFVRSGITWTQQAYLKPAAIGTEQGEDRFGWSVAASGDTVVVGAWEEDSGTLGVNSTPNESASSAGAAYVFVRSGATWTQEAYLKPAAVGTTQAGDNFGWSVAVSGDTVIVGANLEDSSTTGVNSTPDEGPLDAGAANVFVRNTGVWTQQAYLKASNTPAATLVGPGAGDQFGTSVAVSGDTVVVGSPFEDSSSLGINSTHNELASSAGAAYVFVRSAGAWAQEAYLKPAAVGGTQAGDQFGISVAIAGDTVVVGANFEDSSTTGVNSTPNESVLNAGAAYIFVRSAGVWSQQAYLKPAAVGTTQAQDFFGRSVAVSGDTVVVGANSEASSTTGVNSSPDEGALNAGAAYVFVRSGVVWSQEAYLKPAAVGTTQAGDQFGFSVAASGDTVVVGAFAEDSNTTGINSTPNDSTGNSGATYVFVRNSGVWTQQAYLKPSAFGTSQNNDQFGVSVAVAGDTLVVGANGEDSSTTGVNSTPNDDGTANGAGAAYVFVRSGTTWSQQAYLKPATVGTTQAGDAFGRSVGVSGDKVVVGASIEDSSTTGANTVPDELAEAAGAAYVFTRSGTVWSQQAYLKPAAVGTTQAGDGFGFSVAASGDTVVVGANFEDSSMTGVNSMPNEGAGAAGAAYLFFVHLFPPVIAHVNPTGGSTAGGTSVTLYGTDFAGATSVTFGGTAATSFTVNNDNRITATTPARATGLVDVAVTTPFFTGTGTGLYRYATVASTADTDSDGLNDAAELQLGALGFDLSSAQPALVNSFLSNSALFTQTQYDANRTAGQNDVISTPNTYSLYTLSQIQALNVGTPLIQQTSPGQFKLTIGVEKSTTLAPLSFSHFPMTAPQTTINAGKLEFQFTVPDNAAFFQLRAE